MDIGEFADKARGALHGHEDEAEAALEKARDAVKERTGDDLDDKVDLVVDKAKEFLEQEKQG
ncbi:MAG TPA: Rv0909 family putative TA system antitoxin [Actinotalea sp.]